MAGARCLCFSPSGNPGTSGHQAVGPRLSKNDFDCTRVAEHALVLGSDQHVSANSPLSAKDMQCFHWNQQAGNYAFLVSRDQCLHGWLGSVASSRPVRESR